MTKEEIDSGAKRDWPATSVDIVLLTIKDGRLHVAVAPREGVHRHGELALIGATVDKKKDRHLLDTVERVLATRGGLKDIFVEQLYTWGSADQDERGWTVAIVYYGLVPMDRLELAEKDLTFLPVDQMPELPFTHNKFIDTAVWRVRGKGGYSTIPAKLLPKTFTLKQMHEIYQTVLGRPLDINAFRRKVVSLGLVKDTKKKRNSDASDGDRPATLFKLVDNNETFDRSL